MEKALFFITCTTCRARLAVRSAEVIGDISECPKCGLMVEIRPPAGFIMPQSGSAQPDQGDTSPKNVAPPREIKKGPPKAQRPPAPAVAAPLARKPADGPAAAKPAAARMGQTVFMAAAFCPMPDEIVAPPIVRPGGWLGLLAHPVARWLTLAAAPLVGLGIVVGVWGLWSGRHSEPPAAAKQGKADAAVKQPPAQNEAKPPAASSLGRLDRRWLPEHTAWIFSLRGARLAHQPQNDTLLAAADPMWRTSIGAAWTPWD